MLFLMPYKDDNLIYYLNEYLHDIFQEEQLNRISINSKIVIKLNIFKDNKISNNIDKKKVIHSYLSHFNI